MELCVVKLWIELYDGRMVLWSCAWSIMVVGCSYIVAHGVWWWWVLL